MVEDWKQETGGKTTRQVVLPPVFFLFSQTIISHQSFKLIFPAIFL